MLVEHLTAGTKSEHYPVKNNRPLLLTYVTSTCHQSIRWILNTRPYLRALSWGMCSFSYLPVLIIEWHVGLYYVYHTWTNADLLTLVNHRDDPSTFYCILRVYIWRILDQYHIYKLKNIIIHLSIFRSSSRAQWLLSSHCTHEIWYTLERCTRIWFLNLYFVVSTYWPLYVLGATITITLDTVSEYSPMGGNSNQMKKVPIWRFTFDSKRELQR